MKEKEIITITTEQKEVVEFSTADKVRVLIEKDPVVNLTKLSRLLGYSKQNVSTKLNKDSLRTSDLDQICDILGYEVVFIKKSNA